MSRVLWVAFSTFPLRFLEGHKPHVPECKADTNDSDWEEPLQGGKNSITLHSKGSNPHIGGTWICTAKAGLDRPWAGVSNPPHQFLLIILMATLHQQTQNKTVLKYDSEQPQRN